MRRVDSYAHFRAGPDKSSGYCYREKLARVWDPRLPVGMFIGCNPGQANAVDNDATVRKYIGFSTRWGWGGFVAGNLFQYISTDMRAFIERAFIERAAESVNPPYPDAWMAEEVARWNIKVGCLAWGNTPKKIAPLWETRVMDVCLALLKLDVATVAAHYTKQGAPAHLSRLGYTPEPLPYEGIVL